MKIFSDLQLPEPALRLLRHETEAHGHELLLAREPAASVLAEAPPDPAFAEAEIAFGQPDAQAVLDSKVLRWAQVTSAGYTRYDTPDFRAAAEARGLLLTNSSTVFAEACAEHVFAFMLAQARQLPRALRSRVANDTPEYAELRHATPLLRGQRVVILGYGAIAARLAALLEPFHCAVVAMRRQPRGDETVPIVTPEQLDCELGVADHVVNILPENAASRGFVSARLLATMKPGAIFYNIGRGATVDQEALVAVLQSGHLGAAWLDVFTPEPLPTGHPLLVLPHCHMTPHTAGGQGDEWGALVAHFLDNLRRFSAGAPLHDRVM